MFQRCADINSRLLCSLNPLECEIERRQQSEEEDDGEDTSSSSQEFEDVGLREEKALSDSEIKVYFILHKCNDILYDGCDNTLLLCIILYRIAFYFWTVYFIKKSHKFML